MFISIVVSALTVIASASPLKRYNVDPRSITISGVSSGAFMTVQMQVAYSDIVTGSAAFAGGVYWCAKGNAGNALTQCMSGPGDLNIAEHISEARRLADQGQVAPLANLGARALYVFAGEADRVIAARNSAQIVEFYRAFAPDRNIRFDRHPRAGHGLPVLGGNGSVPCGAGGSPWLLDCDWDGAGQALEHLYGPLKTRTQALTKNLVPFDQAGYGTSLHKQGWVYVPKACAEGAFCRMHVALHGCQMNPDFIQDRFARGGGFNEWAESNGIIVLYPQSAKMAGVNPNGCWDWFGFTGANYATRSGSQMVALRQMIAAVSGR